MPVRVGVGEGGGSDDEAGGAADADEDGDDDGDEGEGDAGAGAGGGFADLRRFIIANTPIPTMTTTAATTPRITARELLSESLPPSPQMVDISVFALRSSVKQIYFSVIEDQSMSAIATDVPAGVLQAPIAL